MEDDPVGARVLVVDDDEVICRQLAAGLASSGYQVHTAYDGDQALEQAEQSPPDVAIVDLEMPIGGPVVIRRLKELAGPAVHVIVMTGHDDELHRKEAFDAGTDDFIVKPVGLAEIQRRLAAAILKQRAFVEVRLAKEAADRRMTYGAEASALLAHDLNNSLAVSLGNLQYLAEELTLETEYTDVLASTIRALRRMSGLVANFVDIARFEDAAVKPVVKQEAVRPLLAAVSEVSSTSIKNGVTLTIECPAELTARFDPALIERVLHNLVGNACRYCNAGGEIILAARRWNDASSLEISVTNTGPHVSPEIRQSLFGKYVRGGGGKRGLGLYFCRLVAEAHGGHIEYVSVAAGPCFTVRLPGRA